MSPAAARLLAIPFALTAFGLGVLENWWEGPIPMLSGDPPWLMALAAVASFGVPLGAYFVITRMRPATLRSDPDRRRFVAPSSPSRTIAPLVIVLTWWSGRGVSEGLLEAGREFGHPTFFYWVAGIFAAIAAAVLFIDRPPVSLTPSGVILDRILARRVEVEWDEVAPGEPREPARRNPREVTVGLRSTQTLGPLGGFGTSISLPTGQLHVETRFLVAAVRHYAADPTHRGAIGTEVELERLRDVLRRQAQPIS